MKMVIEKEGIKIWPENAQDEAYLTDTLGFKRNGDRLEAKRVQAYDYDDEDMHIEINGYRSQPISEL